MRAKQSNVFALSGELTSNIVTLDEAALEEVNGGVLPVAVAIAAYAAGGFVAGAGTTVAVAYAVDKLFP